MQGIRTPDIAAWQRFPQAPSTFASTQRSTLVYPRVLAVYNVPQYDRMFLRDRASGAKYNNKCRITIGERAECVWSSVALRLAACHTVLQWEADGTPKLP